MEQLILKVRNEMESQHTHVCMHMHTHTLSHTLAHARMHI